MAKFVFAMNVSLDGYVNHDLFGGAPGPELFRHFIAQTAGLSGSIYGRVMYETMRYWDGDESSWDDAEREYAEGWRRQPKWVVSNTLKEVGPNATLIKGDIEKAAHQLKSELSGEIEIAGPMLAHELRALIDEYHLYMRPYVLGAGKPFFAGARPPLRLIANELIGEDALRLKYVPA